MKAANKYVINVFAVGFVTLTIMSILLLWGRKACQAIFYEDMVVDKAGQVKIQPSKLVPQLDGDPNVVIKSSIDAYIGGGIVSLGLGIVQDVRSLEYGKLGEFFLAGNKDKGSYDLILYDKKSGLIVFYDVLKEKRGCSKKAILYAGPEGIGKAAEKNLGRFSEPHKNLWVSDANSFTFFDKTLSCFFQIRFRDGCVVKGPELSGDYRPLQFCGFTGFDKNEICLGPLVWSPPLRRKASEEDVRTTIYDKNGKLVSATKDHIGTYSQEYCLVIDEFGEIRKLDNKTLELSGAVGYLPAAIDSVGRARPDDLFAYGVRPISINGEYAGTIAGSISREAMELQVVVFDPNGRLIERQGAYINPFRNVGGPTLVILTYILENIQPAFLGLASYFTASDFEAVAGHRGIFILPNSFVAMFARDAIGIVVPFFFALLIISPSIILGLLLALRVNRSAVIVGLSKRARLYWIIGTIFFGLSAYITYRLTQPKDALVSCQNCGKLRRPDMDRCHRCGSKWLMPELTPPTWRVINTSGEKITS